jgi:hypothetical protein
MRKNSSPPDPRGMPVDRGPEALRQEPRTKVRQSGSGRRYPSRRPSRRAASRTSDKFKSGLDLKFQTGIGIKGRQPDPDYQATLSDEG